MTTLPIVALFAALVQSKGSAPAQVRFQPFVVMSGIQSEIQERQTLKVTSAGDWASIQARHFGGDQGVEMRRNVANVSVNFGACIVIALFDGYQRNSEGMSIASIRETTDEVVLRVDRQLHDADTVGQIVNPYLFIVGPKTQKRIVVEVDARQSAGEDVTYTRRAVFAGSVTAKPASKAQPVGGQPVESVVR